MFISMLTAVRLGDLWVNKVSVDFLQQLDLKNRHKTKLQSELGTFGIF